MRRFFTLALILTLTLAACGGQGDSPSSPVGPESAEHRLAQPPEELPDPLEDDRCQLYLQVLEDLWEVDPGLNDNATYLGLDLSGLTHLSAEQRHAVAEKFADDHSLELLEDTWEGLCRAGYIDGDALCWEDGLFFTITTNEAATRDRPTGGLIHAPSEVAGFDAHKWRSGTGAYYFGGCTAQRGKDGTWTYSVGQHAIA